MYLSQVRLSAGDGDVGGIESRVPEGIGARVTGLAGTLVQRNSWDTERAGGGREEANGGTSTQTWYRDEQTPDGTFAAGTVVSGLPHNFRSTQLEMGLHIGMIL